MESCRQELLKDAWKPLPSHLHHTSARLSSRDRRPGTETGFMKFPTSFQSPHLKYTMCSQHFMLLCRLGK